MFPEAAVSNITVNTLRHIRALLDTHIHIKRTESKCRVLPVEKLDVICARFEHSAWKSIGTLAHEDGV
jgi:hypothetical protein